MPLQLIWGMSWCQKLCGHSHMSSVVVRTVSPSPLQCCLSSTLAHTHWTWGTVVPCLGSLALGETSPVREAGNVLGLPLAAGVLCILSLGLSFPSVKRLNGIKQCISLVSTSCFVCCDREGGASFASLLTPGGRSCGCLPS